MSEDESLLGRWSRRKRAAMPAPAEAPVEVAEAAQELPALDTLDAASDYTAFLARGVPADVQRGALQRAWATDPKIADFRGMAEYAWDYNAPAYGRLRATDDVARLLQAVLVPPTAPPPLPAPPESPAPVLAEPAPEPPAAVGTAEVPRLPRHGTALPA